MNVSRVGIMASNPINFKGYTKRQIKGDELDDVRSQMYGIADVCSIEIIDTENMYVVQTNCDEAILYEFFDDEKGNHATQYRALGNVMSEIREFVKNLKKEDKISSKEKYHRGSDTYTDLP